MDIISVSNQKGGVSKTGVSFNLGTALALKHNKKVLLIDLDPQANLSEYLKYEPDGKPTLTQLVMTACTGGRLTPEFVSSAIRHNDTAAEHDRYSCIYIQLQNGLDYCTDEDEEDDDETF